MPPRNWKVLLNQAIDLAERCEAVVLSGHQERPQAKVAYGTLVLNRRLARAVSYVRGDSDFEARILLRSMLEIYYNYAWIRLRQPVRRANRFIKFDPIERLRMMQHSSEEEKTIEFWQAYRRLKKERAKVRRLFRRQGKDGKWRWDSSWSGLNFEARMMEVIRHRTRDDEVLDPFLYSIYRWISSAVHGGPLAMSEVLRVTREGLRPAPRIPRLASDSSLTVAYAMLVSTMEIVGLDIPLGYSHRDELRTHIDRVRAYADA